MTFCVSRWSGKEHIKSLTHLSQKKGSKYDVNKYGRESFKICPDYTNQR